MLSFFFIYGTKILDVCDDNWLLNGGDLSQHYLGWCLYRSSPWTFPLGLTPEYAWPHEISAMYADVIPACAVFFKMMSPLLPETFQYLGLWGLLCYVLQGGLAAVLLRRFIPSLWLSGAFSLFFVFASQLMYRMYTHTALGSQWILLLAFIFLFCKDWLAGKNIWRLVWGAMGALCVGVHGYFVPMVFLIMLAALYMHWWKAGEKKECFFLMGCYVASVFASMWILGAFSLPLAAGAASLGVFGANLDAFFNPVLPAPSQNPILLPQSEFMPVHPVVDGQQEGYSYLGLGGILLVTVAFFMAAWGKFKGERLCGDYAPVAFLCLICMMMAVFPKVAFHETVLFQVHYPDLMNRVLSVFRCSGRFIWIPAYLLLLFSLAKVTGIQGKGVWRKAGIVMAFLLLAVQLADFSPAIKNIHCNIYDGLGRYARAAQAGQDFQATGEGRGMLKDFEIVDEMMKKHKYVAYTDCRYDKADYSLMLSYYAYKNNVKLKEFYLARMPMEQLLAEQEVLQRELRSGRPREDTLYVIADRKEFELYEGLNCYEINGVLLGSKQPLGI
ncbi:DUF6311 domain-containing protein [Selenomonas sp. KH1T6]|uniref:DUF6311 domain-containing protein n=1 Tax=Selenomonas sp. KH1T6 TaxID=3158784 RepID=UPI001114CBE7